ncbi:MAG: hypothetical protein Q8K92_14445, partial [Leadbetterella sp.]|nr:hypothetical protein [Leadbetterella sp.]
MKKIFYLIFYFPQIIFAQWHDANWHFGGLPYFNGSPPLKNAIANTLGNSPTFEVTGTYLQNFQNSVTMSDKDGNLLFYCNGMKIYNKAHQMMENGAGVNAGATASDPYYIEYGYPIYYTMVCLPIGNERYFLFHSRKIDGCSSFAGADILYTVIDMSANNGLGRVLDKNKEIIGCEIGAWCAMSATRHANGQDWWVIVANHDNNRYFRIRLTPEGIAETSIISIDSELGNWGNGRSIFTPDGSKYIDCRNARSARVYEFDRCEGNFGQYQDIPTSADIPYGLGIGATTSANSRYLYLCSGLALTQVDLYASDIASTLDTIALHDDFFDESIYFISFIV